LQQIKTFDDCLVKKMQELPTEGTEAGSLVIMILRRLLKERHFMEEKQRTTFENSISNDSDDEWLVLQRLNMLRDKPALYKAWMLASSPEERCGGTHIH
jgi:hypothetical protein